MAEQVWKWALQIGHNELSLPVGAVALSVLEQYGGIVLYMAVSPTAPTRLRRVFMAGTGWDLPEWVDPSMFIGSVSTAGGDPIWHVFVAD